MSTPTSPSTPPNRAELAARLTQELIQLRDSLVSLSLCLKDWQFEADQTGARHSQHVADEALAKFRLHRCAQLSSGDATKAPAAEGH